MATIDRTNPDQREAAEALVIQYLSEAHATEEALVTTLRAHSAMTPAGAYRDLLERHLGETRQQARSIERRLDELGEGRGLLASGLGLAQTVVGQVLALSKGPVDVLRGKSGEEKLLKNAKDECATEALEIATYDALQTLAEAVGDDKTARLAERHRAQEERMLEELRRHIPPLTHATVLAQVGEQPTYDPTTTGAADAVRGAKEKMAS
jgi:ferritin-like metal-binding protein YciE